MNRISKKGYFIKIAKIVAQRSTCISRNVGSVLVKNSNIISTGYNGVPTGFIHCTPETCVRRNLKSGDQPELCKGVHAEINCIIQAAIHGTSIQGNTILYSTTFPCMSCLKLIIASGIKKLIYLEDYNIENEIKRELLKESNLIIEKFIEKKEKV